MPDQHIATYLRDHLAGSVVAVELLEHLEGAHAGTDLAAFFARLRGDITADQDDNLMRRALSEHAFCVLAKPVSKHVVIYVVHKALEKYYN